MIRESYKALKFTISTADWQFIRSSAFLSGGVVIARILGLAFSLVLARVLIPEDYGYVQYALTVAHVMGLLTQPFVQHVVARFVGQYQGDRKQTETLLSTALFIVLVLFGLTLLVSVAVLSSLNHFSWGILAVYFGSTLFYAYYGLVRGLLDNTRLLVCYLGSNFVQIIAVLVIFAVFKSKSTEAALLIFGLSYLLPLTLLQLYAPVPITIRLAWPQRRWLSRLIRFSAPVWLSHAGYIVYLSIDVLLLERFSGTEAVGQYSLTKTLGMVFAFVPWGINTILMPKIAGAPKAQHRRLLLTSILLYIGVSSIMLVAYTALYASFVRLIFGVGYVVGPDIYLVLALGHIVFGMHSIISSVVVGSDRAKAETLSVLVGTGVSVLVAVVLIPEWGAVGAAATVLIGATVALLMYPLMFAFGRLRRLLAFTLTKAPLAGDET